MNDLPLPSPNVGDTFETPITKLVTGGAGLGRSPDGLTTFVPGTAAGDVVRVRVKRRRKGFLEAELVEVLTASPDRVEPPLGELGSLSGCDLQHLSVAAQLRAKTEIVRDCLARIAGLDPGDLLEGPVPAGPPLGYRNKVRLWRTPAGPYGMLRHDSHEVLPIERHGLMSDAFNDDILPFVVTLPPADQVVVRLDHQDRFLVSLFGEPDRARMLKAVLKKLPEGTAPHPRCLGILYNNRPLWGRDHLVIQLTGHNYRVHATSFFQTNYRETEAAVALVRGWLDEAGVTAAAPGGALLDLYAGVGLFSLALDDLFARIVAVESDEGAVRDARNNVKRERAAAARTAVIDTPVERAVLSWKTGDPADQPGNPGDPAGALDWAATTVVADPPRAGLGEQVAKDLAVLGPARVIYMSCDPATFARDVKTLGEGGYRLKRARVIDMFPMTGHVEVLGELSK